MESTRSRGSVGEERRARLSGSTRGGNAGFTGRVPHVRRVRGGEKHMKAEGGLIK